MEMWLKCATLVLLTAAGAAMVMPTKIIILDHTEKSENVSHGSTLKLCCNLNINKTERCSAKWYFRPVELNQTRKKQEEILNYTGQCSKISLCKVSYRINESIAGSYFCEITVEIPVLATIKSNKTHIIVERGSSSVPPLTTRSQVSPGDNAESWWLWIVIGGSSLILFILLIICVMQRRRWRRSTAEEPIYINTRPTVNKQPSPRPGLLVNNLKTAPSAQDLRSPSSARRYDEGKRRVKS